MIVFLLYTLLLVCLGILVRIFWIPLMVTGAILVILAGIIVSAGLTASILTAIQAIATNSEFLGFNTYFIYSLVFFVVASCVYGAIISDIFEYSVGIIRSIFKKY